MDPKCSLLLLLALFINYIPNKSDALDSNQKSARTRFVDKTRPESRSYKLSLRPPLNFDSTLSPQFRFYPDSYQDNSNNQWLAQTPQENLYNENQQVNSDPKQGEEESPAEDESRIREESSKESIPPVSNPSLDRISVLGGLSPLGFLKLLYFLIPFILPMVFVPLLFLSTAILMIPIMQVTRRIENVRSFKLNHPPNRWKFIENIGNMRY